MIYPCQRCKEVFESQEAVAVHLSRIQSCELRNILIADGVTIEIAEQLKSKKKSHRGESEKDRWQKIYRLLFPRDGDPGPSPCEFGPWPLLFLRPAREPYSPSASPNMHHQTSSPLMINLRWKNTPNTVVASYLA